MDQPTPQVKNAFCLSTFEVKDFQYNDALLPIYSLDRIENLTFSLARKKTKGSDV